MISPIAKFITTILLMVQVVVAPFGGQTLYVPLRDCTTSHHHVHDVDDCAHDATIASAFATGGLALTPHDHDAPSHPQHIASACPADACRCHLHVPVPSDPQPPRQPRSSSSQVSLAHACVDLPTPCRLAVVARIPTISPHEARTPPTQLRAIQSTRLRI